MNAEARKTHFLTVGDLTVELVRTRVKNVNLRVRRNGSVRVSAPGHVPLAEIERFVASKRDWIEDRLRMVQRAAEREHAGLQEGDVVRLWGRELPLRIETVKTAREEAAFQAGEALIVRLLSRWQGNDEVCREHRAKLVDALLRTQLQEALPPLLQRYEAQVGVHASQVRIRRMRTRWGSCNTRTKAITINLQLAELPPKCLEGVVVHELCHLIEPNHGSGFYALMDRHFPTWREVRAQLRSATRR